MCVRLCVINFWNCVIISFRERRNHGVLLGIFSPPLGVTPFPFSVRERAHITPSTLGQFWPPPPCVINIIMALDPPPPLKWWCNMWTEVELLDDFSDTFQIIKICFSTIIRTIFWGLELYSRILSHDSWRNSLVYSWFQVFYSNTCSMFQVSHPSTFKV